MAGDTNGARQRPLRIGVVLVHGIGEQRRYEHLDWHARQIIAALGRQPGARLTVEVISGSASPFHADKDSWAADGAAPVRALVRCGERITHEICFHEVWWADVNERYSIMKQVRFWLWGLAIWAYPQGRGERLHGYTAVTRPRFPGRRAKPGSLATRLPLFAVCSLFALGGFSVGIASALAQRLFSFQTPPFLATLTNFLSAVKIYNQRTRWGPSAFGPPPGDDFIDTLGEPPRVSIRRRVIRTFAKVALERYDAWYVVAHSQGTVAAFNGLMEAPYAWPGYFDEKTWRELCAEGFAGPGAVRGDGETMPRRPVWAGDDEIAYRACIFERLQGVLTLGSPLDKFATIWPARAPICRIPAFREDLAWINAFDPLDPVSDALKAYDRPGLFPPPVNVGFACSPVLLLAHLGYLNWDGEGCLADGVAKWLLSGSPQHILGSHRGFRRGDGVCLRRSAFAGAWWLVAYGAIAVLSGLTLRWATGHGSPLGVLSLSPQAATQVTTRWTGLAVGVSLALTLAVGAISRLRIFKAENDPPPPLDQDEPLQDPARYAGPPCSTAFSGPN